ELHELNGRHERHALAARARVAAVLAAAVALCVPVVVVGADEAASRLADAARARDWQQFGALLERASDVDAFGSDGTPALHWVVRVQDEERARRLLTAGADPRSEEHTSELQSRENL